MSWNQVSAYYSLYYLFYTKHIILDYPDATLKSHGSNVRDKNSSQKPKKKSIFKSLWKRSKHVSLDQQ